MYGPGPIPRFSLHEIAENIISFVYREFNPVYMDSMALRRLKVLAKHVSHDIRNGISTLLLTCPVSALMLQLPLSGSKYSTM